MLSDANIDGQVLETDVIGESITASIPQPNLLAIKPKDLLVASEEFLRVTLCAIVVILLIPMMLMISGFAFFIACSFGVNLSSSTPASVWNKGRPSGTHRSLFRP